MCLWVKKIENGLFQKYSNELSLFFESDGCNIEIILNFPNQWSNLCCDSRLIGGKCKRSPGGDVDSCPNYSFYKLDYQRTINIRS